MKAQIAVCWSSLDCTVVQPVHQGSFRQPDFLPEGPGLQKHVPERALKVMQCHFTSTAFYFLERNHKGHPSFKSDRKFSDMLLNRHNPEHFAYTVSFSYQIINAK
jgi:hypothetical protein